jgi:hypothetical protein
MRSSSSTLQVHLRRDLYDHRDPPASVANHDVQRRTEGKGEAKTNNVPMRK